MYCCIPGGPPAKALLYFEVPLSSAQDELTAMVTRIDSFLQRLPVNKNQPLDRKVRIEAAQELFTLLPSVEGCHECHNGFRI